MEGWRHGFRPSSPASPASRFPAVANAVGGLLTRPENQAATFRLEALAALAAAYAEGDKQPTAAHLRDWLNGVLLQDAIGEFEDPVEDVFVSNVPSWDGNARLFDGLWGDNDVGVEALVWSVMKLKDIRSRKRASK